MTTTGKINAVLAHFRDGATAPGMDTVLEVLEFARVGAAVQPRPWAEFVHGGSDSEQFLVWHGENIFSASRLFIMNMFSAPNYFAPLSSLPQPKKDETI